MAREKNALTKYFVAEVPVNGQDPEWLRLAKWISEVSDESDENVETTAYYDGDGTPEDDVTSIKKGFTFQGQRDDEDPAQNLIASLEFEIGAKRKIMFKQERTNGEVLEGVATVKEIVATGGEASEYAPFSCTITWDRKPTITKNGTSGAQSTGGE